MYSVILFLIALFAYFTAPQMNFELIDIRIRPPLSVHMDFSRWDE